MAAAKRDKEPTNVDDQPLEGTVQPTAASQPPTAPTPTPEITESSTEPRSPCHIQPPSSPSVLDSLVQPSQLHTPRRHLSLACSPVINIGSPSPSTNRDQKRKLTTLVSYFNDSFYCLFVRCFCFILFSCFFGLHVLLLSFFQLPLR